MKLVAIVAFLGFATCELGCSGARARTPSKGESTDSATGSSTADSSTASPIDEELAEVTRIHGGAGPWAVAGYRMGEYALRTLGLERGSFDLEVVHYTPHEIQYSCIADGAAAATGASLGKLNLTLAETSAADTHTVYRNKSTGISLTLKVTEGFAARYANVPREKLREAGREVIQLKDSKIFETVAAH